MVADRIGKDNRRKIFYLVMALIFTDTILYGAIVPLIPIYMKNLQLTTSAIGAIFSAYAFGILILSIPLGVMAEKYGYRKIFLAGMSALALSCFFYGFMNSPGALLLCRFIQGAAGAASWTGGLAIAAVIYPDRQGEKIGLLMAVMGLGTICGPPIGGFLYHLFGYKLMFGILSLLCLILLFCIRLVSFADLPAAKHSQININIFSTLSNARVFWLSAIIVVLASIFGMLEVLMPNHMDGHFGLNTVEIGLCFGFMGIIHAVSDAFSGQLSDRYGYEIFVLGGLVFCAVSLPFLAWAPNIFTLLVVLSLVGAATGAAVTPSQPLLYRIITVQQGENNGGAGYIYGFYNTIYSIGMFLGPLLGGLLNRHFNLFGSLLFFAFLFGAGAVLFYFKVFIPEKKEKILL
ncbi:MAG: MFS transporter [Bacillota bacterium]|jgi:MFS family permease|nr:MFS transporter [Clostridia bacterium]